MHVNSKINRLSKLRTILRQQNGLLFTEDLAKQGIQRTYLSILEKKGEIQRISRGTYLGADQIADEMFSLQARFKSAIFSHETALYLLGLTDRTPLRYTITVPSGYNATAIKKSGVKVYFVARKLFNLSETSSKSPHGNTVRTFALERTICDLLRNRNTIDIQILNQALKRFVAKKEKNINLLYDLAGRFGIQKIVRSYIEILL